MEKNEFFDRQTDLTAAKILIYHQYLSQYLPKILMQYGKCFIADLFCGCGKNGKEDGSPLVLLNIAKKMLESPILKVKHPKAEIVIVFNDNDKECCEDLKSHLSKMTLPSGIKNIGPFCEEFSSIKGKVIDFCKVQTGPRFFFLDPFKYSQIEINDVKALMDIPITEVLMFLPTFHSYRFVKNANKIEALKNFLKDFTDRGAADYADITDFNESIRKKLLSYLRLKYVRTIGLDDGAKKNALFYLTKHPIGMLLMNSLVWKYSTDGNVIVAKDIRQPSLLSTADVSQNYMKKKSLLVDYRWSKGKIANTEIIDFVAQIGFTTHYALDVLKGMQKEQLVEVLYKKADKTRGFYVNEKYWNNHLSDVIYKEAK